MTLFQVSDRNAEDLKVLMIGALCSLFIFVAFTAYDEAPFLVDLVLHK